MDLSTLFGVRMLPFTPDTTQNSMRCKLVPRTAPRSDNRALGACLDAVGIIRDVLDLLSISIDVFDLFVPVAPQGRWLKSHCFATVNANIERPSAAWQLALLMPSVLSTNQQGFRTPALSRWSALGGSPPLVHPQDLGMEVSHSSPLRAARLSLSTPWRPLEHVA